VLKRKRSSLLCLMLLLVVTLAGCSGANVGGENGNNGQQETARLIIGTGGVAGSYYPLGGALAKVWTSKIDGVQVSAQATGAAIENTKLLENNEIELALTQSDLAEYAAKSQHMFDKEYKHMRAVATIFPEHIQIFVRKGSGIKTISDLKGKRVSVGSQGSGGLVNSEQIFGCYGFTFDDIKPFYLTNVDAVDRMKDGQLDAIFVTTAAPNAAYQDLALATDIELLDLPDEDANDIIEEYPFFEKVVLPAGMYHGQETDVLVLAVQAVVTARDDLSEEVVYELTKTLWESKDELGEMMAKANSMDPNDPLKGVTIAIHPGAERYYKEVGMLP